MGPSTARSAPMGLLLSALTVLTLLPVVSAQQILQYGGNNLPTCAQGCTLLNQAQTVCVPPAAPVTNQQTYQTCFCTSAYLTTLSSNPAGICGQFCGQSDLQKIQQWFTGLCKAGAAAPSASSTTTSGAPASSTSAVATADPEPTVPPQDQNQNKSWISTHYQWVIFLIVLILAILFFSIGGVWLKRRLKRRAAARRVGTFNSTVTTATMPGSQPAMAKAPNPSSSRIGTPMGMAGGAGGDGMTDAAAVGGQHGMRSTESGVGSTASGSGSGSAGKGKGPASATVAEDEGDHAGRTV